MYPETNSLWVRFFSLLAWGILVFVFAFAILFLWMGRPRAVVVQNETTYPLNGLYLSVGKEVHPLGVVGKKQQRKIWLRPSIGQYRLFTSFQKQLYPQADCGEHDFRNGSVFSLVLAELRIKKVFHKSPLILQVERTYLGSRMRYSFMCDWDFKGSWKNKHPLLIKVLLPLLKKPNHALRRGVISAFTKLKTKDQRVVNAIRQALQDPNTSVRLSAFHFLKKLKEGK